MATLSPFVLRPDKGGVTGKKIQLKVNIFPIRALADTISYQYDVAFTPDVSAAVNRRAWKLVEPQLKKMHGDKCLLAFDGKKNAFGVFEMTDTTLEVDVTKDDDIYIPPLREQPSGGGDRGGRGGGRGGRGGRGGGRGGFAPSGPRQMVIPIPAPSKTAGGKTEKVKVVIRKVAQINLHELLLFTQGKGPETENVLHASTALSVVLRHVPAMTFIPVGANFFSPENRTPIAGGLEVWRGFHQSPRAMLAGHLGINIDIASTVFRKGEISVIDYALEIFNCPDVASLSRIPRITDKLNAELKGVNVVTIHRGDNKQRFKIGRISRESADQFAFDNKETGKKMTVAQYFEQQVKIKLRFPFLPLALKSNGKTAFPLECLKIAPAQRFMKKLSGDQTSDMIRATVQKPQDRAAVIEKAVNSNLKYDNNPYMDAFGLKVSREMMKVDARVLPAPKVVFDQNKSLPGNDGQWNMRGVKLVEGQTLSSCAFVFFCRVDQAQAQELRTDLLRKWATTGIKVSAYDCPVRICNPNQPNAVQNIMRDVFTEANKKYGQRIQLVVCILDKDPKDLYAQIKKIALTEAGIMTQCAQWKNFRMGIKDQYAANLALKANIKLGGATNRVDSIPFMDRPTLLVGADVTHAPPGSAAPSIAAVVTSTDRYATKYHTFLRNQGRRLEIIEDMQSIMHEALTNFAKASGGKYPERIVFFRDGVASGQFAEVKEKEIKAIKAACAALKLNTKVTFVIVQKRHHIRLFPIDNNRDRSDNALAGTVIDTQITHPTEFNFVLQSHAGLQGTSRPTIYHVIYDEIKMGSDNLQQLCFNLCFLAERATRTINMVAPAYRAHIAAYYGRMFLEGEYSDTASSRSGGSGEGKIAWKNVTNAMQTTMYYM